MCAVPPFPLGDAGAVQHVSRSSGLGNLRDKQHAGLPLKSMKNENENGRMRYIRIGAALGFVTVFPDSMDYLFGIATLGGV